MKQLIGSFSFFSLMKTTEIGQKEGNFLATIVVIYTIKWKHSQFRFIAVYQNNRTLKSFINPPLTILLNLILHISLKKVFLPKW